ncbi:MAG: aminodeoxychorismate/anthranilate synthase component II [Gemmatimonadales bacterium]
MKRVLLIDNYDSFVYNLAQAFQILGAEVVVRRNDQITAAEARAFDPSHLVVSPGPGRPEVAGNSISIIRAMIDQIPILGVCLGHQALVVALGGLVVHAKRLMHGKVSAIHHDGIGLFAGLPQPFKAGRYHSLLVDRLPDDLTASAYTREWEVMAVRHVSLPVAGVQFHPESILTPDGDRLLENFLTFRPGAVVKEREKEAV